MTYGPARNLTSYSHRYYESLDRFWAVMRAMELKDQVQVWDDTNIEPGTKRAEEIDRSQELAPVIVPLVSVDFLTSEFVREEQLPRILERADAREAVVVPIILSPVIVPPELARLASLPTDGRSILEQPDADLAWAEAAKAIGKVAAKIEGRDWSGSACGLLAGESAARVADRERPSAMPTTS